MDALAYELQMDPIDFRMRNEPEKDPVSGNEFSSRHMREAYALGAEKFGWKTRPAAVRSQRDGDWLIGQGVATGTYPMYRMVTAARVRLNADGTALIESSAQEMGMGTETVQTQHAAELLGLPMEKVHFEYGDSSLPWAGVAGGSSQTVSIALAVQQASEKLLTELLSLAQKAPTSVLKGAEAADVRMANEGLFRKEQPSVGETYAAILKRAKKTPWQRSTKPGRRSKP